jgi:hypothetical protein
VSVNSAPIGAQVFTIERRNHSKTRVYEDLCTRVPVDTTIATDKLKKAEKGFKFARFDVSFQPIGSLLYRQGSKDRLERGSARMGGLPFESAPPNRRWPSRRCNLLIASGPAFSGLDRPSTGALQSRSQSAQPSEFTTLLRRLPAGPKCPSAAVIWTTQRYIRRTDSNLPGSESRDSDVLFQAEGGHDLWPGPQSSKSSAAQRLQYGLGEGWDDCSSPQESAGRDNEETAE